MDFELFDEWMEQFELFLYQFYDIKKVMIEDLCKFIMIEMVLQEINCYVDSEFCYVDKFDEVVIDVMVCDFG